MIISSNIGLVTIFPPIALKVEMMMNLQTFSGRELQKRAEMKNYCNICVQPNFVGMEMD